MGRTFQITRVFSDLTVLENLTLALHGLSREQAVPAAPVAQLPRTRPSEAAELAARFGLAQRLGTRAAELSHGEIRELEVLLALALKPRVLLLDEPAAGLSPAERVDIQALLRSLPAELTLIMIEHDVDLLRDGGGLGRGAAPGRSGGPGPDPGDAATTSGSASSTWAGPRRERARAGPGRPVTAMIEVRDLHTYRGINYVLQGVNLSIADGACTVLLGRNGMGKTTLVHTIMGLLRPRSGQIMLGDEDLAGKQPFQIARRGMALVPQGRRIFPSLTVEENLTLAARGEGAADGAPGRWSGSTTCSATCRSGGAPRGGQLSGGEQQMLAVGRALLTNPRLLLMDEPSEGLAPVLIERIGEIIADLRRSGLSIFLVEQNYGLAVDPADTIYILSNGQVVWQGTARRTRESSALGAGDAPGYLIRTRRKGRHGQGIPHRAPLGPGLAGRRGRAVVAGGVQVKVFY